jgi:hypothetical protein
MGPCRSMSFKQMRSSHFIKQMCRGSLSGWYQGGRFVTRALFRSPGCSELKATTIVRLSLDFSEVLQTSAKKEHSRRTCEPSPAQTRPLYNSGPHGRTSSCPLKASRCVPSVKRDQPSHPAERKVMTPSCRRTRRDVLAAGIGKGHVR